MSLVHEVIWTLVGDRFEHEGYFFELATSDEREISFCTYDSAGKKAVKVTIYSDGRKIAIEDGWSLVYTKIRKISNIFDMALHFDRKPVTEHPNIAAVHILSPSSEIICNIHVKMYDLLKSMIYDRCSYDDLFDDLRSKFK
jgi:hypothetical protein